MIKRSEEIRNSHTKEEEEKSKKKPITFDFICLICSFVDRRNDE